MSKMFINAYMLNSTQIMHIYSENGVVKKETVNFKPFLGTHAGKNEQTSWTDMYGKPVKIKVFEDIPSMYVWKKQSKNVLEIFGDIDPVDMFVASTYRGDIELDKTGMKIFNIDIEVFVPEGGGFPKATEAKFPINAITVNEMVTNTYYSFFWGKYIPQNDNEIVVECTDEKDLISKFLDFWNISDPQIITGWSINGFDIPYLVNRIINVFGPQQAKRLSTDRVIKKKKEFDTTGRELITYTLQGHIIWDYIELYKKYTQENRESYTLDNIASVELGDSKIDFKDDKYIHPKKEKLIKMKQLLNEKLNSL